MNSISAIDALVFNVYTPEPRHGKYVEFSLAPRILMPLHFEVDCAFSAEEIMSFITETVRKYETENEYKWKFTKRCFVGGPSNTWKIYHTEAKPKYYIFQRTVDEMEFHIHVFQKNAAEEIAIVEFQTMFGEPYIMGDIYREVCDHLISPEAARAEDEKWNAYGFL
jgi:hypothetical protein